MLDIVILCPLPSVSSLAMGELMSARQADCTNFSGSKTVAYNQSVSIVGDIIMVAFRHRSAYASIH